MKSKKEKEQNSTANRTVESNKIEEEQTRSKLESIVKEQKKSGTNVRKQSKKKVRTEEWNKQLRIVKRKGRRTAESWAYLLAKEQERRKKNN